jgi:hypothetical protein
MAFYINFAVITAASVIRHIVCLTKVLDFLVAISVDMDIDDVQKHKFMENYLVETKFV